MNHDFAIAAVAAAKSVQSFDSMWPYRQQPTRLLCPQDSLGKNTGVGCHFLLQNVYSEYIMWNAGLDEAQAIIKTAGRIITNLRCADDTTLMAESEEELKSLLMKVKEENEKAGLKLNFQKTKMMALVPSVHGK